VDLRNRDNDLIFQNMLLKTARAE